MHIEDTNLLVVYDFVDKTEIYDALSNNDKKALLALENIEMYNAAELPYPLIYFYYNEKNEIIYVGKSQDYYRRHQDHIMSDKYMTEVAKIGFLQVPTLSLMDLLEIYYIGRIMPQYNKSCCHPDEKGVAFQDIEIDVSDFIHDSYFEVTIEYLNKVWNNNE